MGRGIEGGEEGKRMEKEKGRKEGEARWREKGGRREEGGRRRQGVTHSSPGETKEGGESITLHSSFLIPESTPKSPTPKIENMTTDSAELITFPERFYCVMATPLFALSGEEEEALEATSKVTRACTEVSFFRNIVGFFSGSLPGEKLIFW
jgi:hypothetical protein